MLQSIANSNARGGWALQRPVAMRARGHCSNFQHQHPTVPDNVFSYKYRRVPCAEYIDRCDRWQVWTFSADAVSRLTHWLTC